MTVIATDGITIAFDTMVVMGAPRIGDMDKVVEVAPGIFVGGAGHAENVQAFIEWQKVCMKSGYAPKPEMDESFSGIMFNARNGEVWSYGEKLFPLRVAVPFAIGVAGDIALGAMMAGRRPVDAVEICIRLSPMCGGEAKQLPEKIPHHGPQSCVFDPHGLPDGYAGTELTEGDKGS